MIRVLKVYLAPFKPVGFSKSLKIYIDENVEGCTGNSAHGNKQEKKINAYDWKEIKVSLFTDDMIVYIANSKESILKKKRKLKELVGSARFQDTRSAHKM